MSKNFGISISGCPASILVSKTKKNTLPYKEQTFYLTSNLSHDLSTVVIKATNSIAIWNEIQNN